MKKSYSRKKQAANARGPRALHYVHFTPPRSADILLNCFIANRRQYFMHFFFGDLRLEVRGPRGKYKLILIGIFYKGKIIQTAFQASIYKIRSMGTR